MFMKTFEEKWTAWLDGQLSGRELTEFEASLPDKAAADAERAEAKKLGTLLKRELSAQALTNDEFFSHQVHERIVRESASQSLDRGFAVVASGLRSQITAHGSFPAALDRLYRADHERGGGLARRGDGVERTCDRRERGATASDSTGTDSD